MVSSPAAPAPCPFASGTESQCRHYIRSSESESRTLCQYEDASTRACTRHVIQTYSTEWIRLIFAGRILPAVIFGYLSWRQIGNVEALIPTVRSSHLIEDFFLRLAPALFYLPYSIMCTLIYLTRPAPHARDSRLIAWLAAFAGTLLIAMVGAFAPPGPQLYTLPLWTHFVVTVALLLAVILAVTSLVYLRHSLSVIPEARRVVRSGPYRFVRHPLYLAEMLGVGVVILAGGRALLLAVLVLEIFLQYTRARFEERLLRATFPDYVQYARRTSAIVPGLI